MNLMDYFSENDFIFRKSQLFFMKSGFYSCLNFLDDGDLCYNHQASIVN